MAIIQNEDWNPVETKMRSVLSTPDGTTADLGYNTTYSRSAVVGGDAVTGAQWNALRTDVNKAYLLQTGSNSDLTTRDSTAKITQADLTAISARVDTAYSNRGSVSTGQLNFVAGPAFSLNITGQEASGIQAWASDAINGTFITWNNNAAFRGFWNGGGRLIFTAGRSGGDATSQNQSWTNLFTNMGSIVLTRNSMFQSGQSWNGSFSNSFASNGVYGTSGVPSNQQIAFSINSQDTNYTANFAELWVWYNSTDVFARTSISCYWRWIDSHTASGSNTPSEVGGGGPTGFGPDWMNGTFTANCGIYMPFSQTRPNNY